MKNYKILILYFILLLSFSAFVKCHTIYNSKIEQNKCNEITRITGVVTIDESSKLETINFDLDWCDSYGGDSCCNKKNIKKSVDMIVEIGGQEIPFEGKKEDLYQFKSVKESLFEQNKMLDVKMFYKIDSAGFELNRYHVYKLFKDSECGFSVH